MKTRFYKILYKNRDVVYIGVTTRPVAKRFQEHIVSKGLNEDYSVIEFDCIRHPVLDSLETYYEERKKIVELEQKYIREEIQRGSHLLNISVGGEWGSQVIEKLRKEDFYRRFSSYDNYEEYKAQADKCRGWLDNWVECRGMNRTKRWLLSYLKHKTENKTNKWLQHWVECRSFKKTKRWLQYWVKNKSRIKTKVWLLNWTFNSSRCKTEIWMRSWVQHRSDKKLKVWLRNWMNCRTRNKLKVWLRNWVAHRS